MTSPTQSRLTKGKIWVATVATIAVATPPVWILCGIPATILFVLLLGLLGYLTTILQEQRHFGAQLRAMRESESQLRTITSTLPLFLYRCRNDLNWTTLFKTEGCSVVTGYTAAEFLSGSIRFGSLIVPAHQDRVWKKWQQALNSRIPLEIEYPIRHADGSERWIWEQGQGVYSQEGSLQFIEGLVVDITDRKQAEVERDRLLEEADNTRRALLSVLEDERRGQAERTRLVSAIEQTGESILITDTEGVIRYVNPAFTKFSGYMPDEVLGKHTRILKSGTEPEEIYRQLWETVSSGKVWTGRLVNRRKDGTLHTEYISMSPVTNPQNEITSYVSVKRDITKEIELEQQLLQAQKMELVGQMAGGIAHDFNNILQVITGFIDLAIEDSDDPVLLQEYLGEVRKASKSAAALTRRLLTFSRRQIMSKQALDLTEFVNNMAEMIRRALGEDIVFEWNPKKVSVGKIQGDPSQLEHAFFNLILNAKHAMPNGGRLTISLKQEEFTNDEITSQPDAQAGKYVCVAVSDTGTGIPPEIRSKIFEPFFTTKTGGQGTGLGLASVYGIVKQHEGWLSVYSEENVGSEFRVYLPLAFTEEITCSPLPVKTKDEELKGNGEGILVVEDEEGIRLLMQKILRAAGYNVTCASSAEEGEAVYEKNPTDFHLVVSDVVLPNRSGFDMATSLKEKNPDLKVLMISGYTDERTRWPLIRQKGWRYLQKPVNRKLLLKVLHETLNASPEAEPDAG